MILCADDLFANNNIKSILKIVNSKKINGILENKILINKENIIKYKKLFNNKKGITKKKLVNKFNRLETYSKEFFTEQRRPRSHFAMQTGCGITDSQRLFGHYTARPSATPCSFLNISRGLLSLTHKGM